MWDTLKKRFECIHLFKYILISDKRLNSAIGSFSSSSLVIIVKILIKLVWMLARPSLVDVGKDKLPDYKKKGGERDGAQPLFPSFFHLYFPPSSIIAISRFSLIFFFPASIQFHSNTIHYSTVLFDICDFVHIFLLFMLHLSYIYNILLFLLHKCISQTKEIQIHSTSSTSAIRPRKLFPFLSSLIFSLWFVSKIYFCLVIIKYNILLRIELKIEN